MNDADAIPEQSGEFESMLEDLRLHYDSDLTGYKRGTLWRRVNRRMQQVNVGPLREYRDYVMTRPEEFRALLDTIRINVTAFFRNAPAWQILAQEIIPAIVLRKAPHDGIRIWSAGCASGEEPVTLAMLWADALGLDDYHHRVKIYATDVDEGALSQARAGAYPAKSLDVMPSELRARYFEKSGPQYVCRADLRRSIVFGRHDLTRDAPISHLDLIVCRNTLIYLTAPTQHRVLAGFHFALDDRGFLFLGKAETLLSHGRLFRALYLKHRFFSKTAPSDRLALLAEARGGRPLAVLDKAVQLGARALSVLPFPQVVVDVDGTLTSANERARLMFGLVGKDIGRPLRELDRPNDPLNLCGLIATAVDRPAADVAEAQSETNDARGRVDVAMTQLQDAEGRLLGASFIFAHRSAEQWRTALADATRELETAHAKHRRSTERRRAMGARLQVAAEELALQSVTLRKAKARRDEMSARLHTAHRELDRASDELRGRMHALNRVAGVLEAVGASRDSAG